MPVIVTSFERHKKYGVMDPLKMISHDLTLLLFFWDQEFSCFQLLYDANPSVGYGKIYRYMQSQCSS